MVRVKYEIPVSLSPQGNMQLCTDTKLSSRYDTNSVPDYLYVLETV